MKLASTTDQDKNGTDAPLCRCGHGPVQHYGDKGRCRGRLTDQSVCLCEAFDATPEASAPLDLTRASDEQIRGEFWRRFGEQPQEPPPPRRELTDDELREQFFSRGLFREEDVEHLTWDHLLAALAAMEESLRESDEIRARIRALGKASGK